MLCLAMLSTEATQIYRWRERLRLLFLWRNAETLYEKLDWMLFDGWIHGGDSLNMEPVLHALKVNLRTASVVATSGAAYQTGWWFWTGLKKMQS